MSVLAFAVHVAAVVLAVAGVAKVADPTPVTRSLRVAGLPSSHSAGRALGAGELAVAVWVLAAGGRLAAAALGIWFAGFVVYLVANRLRGLDVPCGCIGDSDRPAGIGHLVIDLVAAGAAFGAIVWPVSDATVWLDHGAGGILALVGIAVVSAGVVVLVLPGRIGAGTTS